MFSPGCASLQRWFSKRHGTYDTRANRRSMLTQLVGFLLRAFWRRTHSSSTLSPQVFVGAMQPSEARPLMMMDPFYLVPA